MGTAPTRDGGVIGKAFTTGSSLQFTITTVFNDDIVVVCIGNSLNTPTPATVSSIGGGGLTFAKRASATLTSVAIPSDGTGALEVETWWAHAPNPLTAQTLTVTMNNPVVRAELVASAWNGCNNLNNPWDTNASLPAIVATSTTPTTISFSTDQPDDALFLFTCNSHNNSTSPPSGYSNLGSSSTTGGGTYPDTRVAVYGQGVASKQSSVSITDGSNNSVIYIADALTGDPTGQVWFALDGGNWNGNPSADPVAGIGGIDISPIIGQLVYPTIQGSGDYIVTCNFGATAFAHAAPSTFTAGWPHAGGGFTTLDPAKLYGSAALSGGNLVSTFSTVQGMAQAVDGYTTGRYYFELAGNPDLFSTFGGGGVAINFNPGGNFNFWIASSAFNTGLPNAGAAAKSGGFNTFTLNAQALNITGIAAIGSPFSSGHILRIAVALAPATVPQNANTADTWFGPTSGFVDLTLAANRRKFISNAGCTVNLGSTGSVPFGVTPPVFLTRFTGNAPNTFATNNGNGGTFTISGGALTDAGSMPCCDTTSLTVTTPPSLGNGVVGDYRNGALYAFNMDTLLDNGTQRKWLRTWRALQEKRTPTTRFSSLRLDMETGSTENPIAGNPQIVLRWSDDGGSTWSVPRLIPAGKVGNTIAAVRATRLGSSRRFKRNDRIFEISSTDAFKVAIIKADVEAS